MSAETLAKRRPQDLEDLARNVSAPFNDESVLHTFSALACELAATLPDYDVVIGDDISGRLPAMVYWRMINRVRLAEGLPRAEMRFANGRSKSDFPPGFLPEATLGARALILTEYVFSGNSAMNLYEAAANQRSGNCIDVAALSSYEMFTLRRLPNMSRGANFYRTPAGTHFGACLHAHVQPGVKDSLGVVKSRKELFSHRDPSSDMKRVRQARADVAKVANYLYERSILHL
jgi:hypothetical protein